MTSTGVCIRAISGSDSLEELTDLLHKAYAIRAEQGFRFTATYQDVGITRSRLKGGICFLAEIDGLVVGTATIKPPEANDEEYYSQPGVWLFTQYGVLPEHRGKGIGKALFEACVDAAKAGGATEIALDTPETAYDLISMYEAWGFKIVSRIDYQNTNYVSVIMSKLLENEPEKQND